VKGGPDTRIRLRNACTFLALHAGARHQTRPQSQQERVTASPGPQYHHISHGVSVGTFGSDLGHSTRRPAVLRSGPVVLTGATQRTAGVWYACGASPGRRGRQTGAFRVRPRRPSPTSPLSAEPVYEVSYRTVHLSPHSTAHSVADQVASVAVGAVRIAGCGVTIVMIDRLLLAPSAAKNSCFGRLITLYVPVVFLPDRGVHPVVCDYVGPSYLCVWVYELLFT